MFQKCLKSVHALLARSVFLTFGLSAEMAAADAAIQIKLFGSERIVLIIPNEKIEDIMKIVKSLEESG